MTASCVYLWILRSFSEHLFYRAPLENCLFYVQVAEFQLADTVKNHFTGAFQAFYKRARSSHSKTFIYLKFLRNICEEVNSQWSCEMAICRFTKTTLSHTHLHVFCLNLRGFESVCKHNFFQEI